MTQVHLSHTFFVLTSYFCLGAGAFMAQAFWEFSMGVLPFLFTFLCATLSLAFSIPTQYRFNRIIEGSPYKSNLHDLMTTICSVAMVCGPIWMGFTAGNLQTQYDGKIASKSFLGIMMFLIACAILDVGAWKIMEPGEISRGSVSEGDVANEDEPYSVLHSSLHSGLSNMIPSGRIIVDKSQSACIVPGPKDRWYDTYDSVPVAGNDPELGDGGGSELVRKQFQLNADCGDFEKIKKTASKPKFTLGMENDSDTDSSDSDSAELGMENGDEEETLVPARRSSVPTKSTASSSSTKMKSTPKQESTKPKQPEAKKLKGQVFVKEHWFPAELTLNEGGGFDATVLPSIIADELGVSGEEFPDMRGSLVRIENAAR